MPLLALAAHGQELTENITIVNVTAEVKPGLYVSAWIEGETLYTRVTASVIGSEPPAVTLSVGYLGGKQYEKQVAPSGYHCTGPICYVDVAVPLPEGVTEAWVAVEAEGYQANITVRAPEERGAPLETLLYATAPSLMAASLMIRGNLRDAGLGALAAGVLIYLLSLAGLAEPRPAVVLVTIVLGAFMLWVSR